jgi:O-antigen biosynthesis protein
MIFDKKFLTHIINCLNMYRFVWGASDLVKTPTNLLLNQKSIHVGQELPSCYYVLKNKLLPGWYMLELKIKSISVISQGVIFFYEKNNKHTASSLALPVHSGRMFKRIMYVDDCKKLFFEAESNKRDEELQHFKLIRVSKKFAKSRMLAKLHLLHPDYKSAMESNITDAITENEKDLMSLWFDYCLLFEGNEKIIPYSKWIKKFEGASDKSLISKLKEIDKFPSKPKISIIMSLFNPNPICISEAIKSVIEQSYFDWELCIVINSSMEVGSYDELHQIANADSRIKLLYGKKIEDISELYNAALKVTNGEWLILLNDQDLLAKHALLYVVDSINTSPSIRLIYSDIDRVDKLGNRIDPYFKPDWDQDLFYSQGDFLHFSVYKMSLVNEVRGFHYGYEGSLIYDLTLRCTERIDKKQIHHIPRVLCHRQANKDIVADSKISSREKSLNDHFARKGIKVKLEQVQNGHRVKYKIPNEPPCVSIIIPTKDRITLLEKCIDSILMKTEYSNYEIIILDNGSVEPESINYLSRLSENSKIRVISDDSAFNYSKLNNSAADEACGDVLLLLNNDVEIINNDWLAEMVSHVLRPEIGVVGAKLYYPDDTIQHAGVVLGIHGVAGHVHRFLPKDNAGYFGRANLIQSFSAVTGACMAVRKQVYLEVGGMNEELPIACNDIDFCLKVRGAGYTNVWTPYAELYHHESASRGFDDTPEKIERSKKEVAYMQKRWGDIIKNDPAYNPNLTLDFEDFSLAWPPRTVDYKNYE